MLDYSRFSAPHGPPAADADEQALSWLKQTVVPVWIQAYAARRASTYLVSTQLGVGVFLFDVRPGRLVAAWAVSRGAVRVPRDRTRMQRFPKGGGRLYHRGHAIPHSLGGPLDLNLVPQLGSVNTGAFRELEIEAVATTGALYFTFWYYSHRGDQRPHGVDQGLLPPGGQLRVVHHVN